MKRALHCLIVLVPLFGAAMASSSARADFYVYTDENGVTHYSNVPPPSRRGVRVIRTAASQPQA
ncbi:MAG: DUF4124 domain-containing protein, partial [Sandaracinaceae bacterium]|nr:DUF4124 domain-containing protein [Sandaracinaceae bacterium]